MLQQILLSIAVALAFLAGPLLYLGTIGEVDWLQKKYPKLKNLSKLLLVIAAVAPVLLAVSSQYQKQVAIVLFASLTALSSITAKGKKKAVLIAGLKSVLIFIAVFLILLALRTLIF